MSTIGRLSYFDIYARAEPMRMLLSHAKVEFEDHRISQEEWPSQKEKFAFKVVPVW